MKTFYARTANTGLTSILYCVFTQHNRPALFIFSEDIKREVKDLYVQYVTREIPYYQDDIVGITEAQEIIKKYDLTSFSG
jgi:hypothetical protein